MTNAPLYTEYRPRWLRRRTSTYWWLERWPYVVFILREISSVFVAWFVLYLLVLIRAVSLGDMPYEAFLRWSRNPAILVLNVVTLLFVTFHAITWFNLAPRAMVVHMRGKRVPPALIAGSNYAAWVVASAVVAWLLLRS
jgi:fumarate reductase subunit C